MYPLFKHPIRVIVRLFGIGGVLALAAFRYARHCARRTPAESREARSRWLQETCQRLLRTLELTPSVTGTIPSRGLLISNHLSYLDILVLGACAPTVFVAKQEVRSWPVFGWFATLAGTLFVQRERRTHVGEIKDSMERALQDGALVVLFPEGTSSDGRTVLPFKSALLEPAAGHNHPLSACLIQYQLTDGDVGEEVCYWKDMTLFPHLLNLLSKRTLGATLHFIQPAERQTDRKELARQLHTEVLKLMRPMAA
jgi:1-acyl-sn-glycerol-3-phosphate acyltransferase